MIASENRNHPLTLTDLADRFGRMPCRRILSHPAPGTAAERGVLTLLRTRRLCELVDGVLSLAARSCGAAKCGSPRFFPCWTKLSLWNGQAPEGRNTLARGASPCPPGKEIVEPRRGDIDFVHKFAAPDMTDHCSSPTSLCRPSGAPVHPDIVQELTPLAKISRRSVALLRLW